MGESTAKVEPFNHVEKQQHHLNIRLLDLEKRLVTETLVKAFEYMDRFERMQLVTCVLRLIAEILQSA